MPTKSKKKSKKQKHSAPKKATKKGMLSVPNFLDSLDIILDKLYRLAYYMGAQMVRYERRTSRRLETWFNRLRDKLAEKKKKRRASFARYIKTIVRDVVTPIVTIRSRFSQYGERIRKAKSFGKSEATAELLRIVWEVILLNLHVISNILNYVAPVAAVMVLVVTINHFNSLTFALSVNYGGKNIGYISDESVFENAEKEVKKRIIYEDTAPPIALSKSNSNVLAEYVSADGETHEPASEGQQAVSMPQYTLAVVTEDQLVNESALTDRIIQASGGEITQASGLYVEGDFKGASTNPELILDAMNAMLDQYDTDSENETIQFVNKIELKDGLYPVQSLKDVQTISSMLSGNVSGESYYTVVAGDSPSLIADKTGVPLKEITAMNPDLTDNFLPGKQLLVSRSVPMMKVQVIRRETYEEDIPYDTERVDNAKLLKGVEQVTTKGVNGTMKIVADITYIDGVAVEKNIVNEERILEPRNEVVAVGTNVPKATGNGTSTGGFIWPVVGSYGYNYISSPIWGYPGHTGTDIAARSGTPVVAAMSGRVVTVKSNRYGYGKHVIIDHGGGITTVYAHNSALYVSVGQYVQQGQTIAAVGRTGNATGNHCHFEIRQNGAYLDARKYIGSRSPY